MKRRDFIQSTTLTALGASVLPLAGLAAAPEVTYLSSDELSPSKGLSNDFPLNFMAVGDWGRNGEYEQDVVAKQMGVWGAANPNNFVISVGDNFYPAGVASENDPLFNHSFENVYTAHSLQCDWYPVLGNHDYLANPDAQVKYSDVSRRWKMPAKYCSKEVNLGSSADKALLVMIDTDPMLFESKKDYVTGQLAWLNKTLDNASPEVKWKIVVGHHPCYTVGPRIKNYDTLTVRKILADVLVKHKVDVYLSGHDHSLQHLKPEGFPHQFISGAGSELTHVTAGIPYSKFEASDHGFMYISVDKSRLHMKAINLNGKILHETELTK